MFKEKMEELVKSGVKPKEAISKALAFERKMRKEAPPEEEKIDKVDETPEAILVEASKEMISPSPLDQAALDAIAARKKKRKFV